MQGDDRSIFAAPVAMLVAADAPIATTAIVSMSLGYWTAMIATVTVTVSVHS